MRAINAYLAIPIDKVAAFNCTITRWFSHREGMCPIFSGYRIEMMWDHGEINPLSTSTGAYGEVFGWLERVLSFLFSAAKSDKIKAINQSVNELESDDEFDVILTDPPYYDAIPYSDSMDFFYVWLKRTLSGVSFEYDQAFTHNLSPNGILIKTMVN